jgi:hypothetical protein
MSELKVNKISPRSGTDVTLGDSGDTFTVPAGATLSNLGTASGFGLTWQSSIVTAATLTAVSGNGYWINTTSNACTITLPASASVGDTIIFVDYARTWGTNAVTINQNSLNFQGATTPNPIYNTDGQSVTITYSGATQGWIPTVDDAVTYETPPPYSVDFLVIAGGGSGGSARGGGGGAGGYRTSTQSVGIGTVITVTVGDGGASVYNAQGNQGSSSSISGSGLTTITSAGGGSGGSDSPVDTSGGNGGSGGGSLRTAAGGTGNTPSTSPSQGNNGGIGAAAPNYGAGGGGGASAVGVNGTTTVGGNGGAGTASSITGSSVTRAGGGAGGVYEGGTGGTGGTGGGGNATAGAVGTAGTANTGSGGGGGSYQSPTGAFNSGAGGKGVVILSIPTANYSGTITGSPTESTSGSNKILVFNGDGSYTA